MLRKITLLIALVALLIPVAGVQASLTDDTVNCRDLVETDCQILRENARVMDDVYGMHFDMLLDLSVNLGGLVDLLQVSGTGGGKIAVDPAAADAAAAGDSEDGSDAFIALLATSMTGEVSLNLTGETPEDDIDTHFILLMKDGVFVLNEGAMETLGGRMVPGIEWIGYDARGAVDELLAEVGAEDDGATSPEMDEANANAMSLARLADEEIMGTPVAVLETNVDINSLLSLITLEDVLAIAEPDEVQYADLMTLIVQNTDVRDLSVRQYIGLEDHYTHRIEFSMDLTISGEFMDMEGMDFELAMTVAIDLSAFNEPFEVALPEDVMLIPLEMLLGMGL